MSLVGPVVISLSTDRRAGNAYGSLPILSALFLGMGAILIGGVLKYSETLYAFSPVITIVVSLAVAFIVASGGTARASVK